MPELPEVEVLRRSLEPRLAGRWVEGIAVHESRLREPVSRTDLEAVRGRSVHAVRRRGKYLLLDVSGGLTVVVHLGMSGRLTLVAATASVARHEHVALQLDDAERLAFVDPRRFGLVLVVPTSDLASDPHFRHLGPEPLGSELGGAWLQRAAAGRRGPVKAFLMDPSVVVGVGNIYASEALHRAGIHPRRSVARIGRQRWESLARGIKEVLADAIAQGGTTIADFVDGAGQAGSFQISLAVYDRAGEPCPTGGCTGRVRRIVQANRSTYFCPRCQR